MIPANRTATKSNFICRIYPTDGTLPLGPSLVALAAPGDLALELTVTDEVIIGNGSIGSAWLVDV